MCKEQNDRLFKESIVVAHPIQQHSYKLATALKKGNFLKAYCTTVYYNEKKFIYKFLERVLGSNTAKRMKGRKCSFIEHNVYQFNEMVGLLFLLLGRIDKRNLIQAKIYKIMTKRFGDNIFKLVNKIGAKAVIMYDTNSLYCFKKIKKSSKIIKIMDMSSIPVQTLCKIIECDKQSNNPFIGSYKVKLRDYSVKYSEDYGKEIFLTDFFLVASKFVRESLLELGIRKDQIYVIPYGVDLKKFNMKKNHNVSINSKLRFLFVGRLEAAKGIYYLLEAFKQLNRDDIELILVGSMCGQEKLFEPYKDYYTYLGMKLPSDMPDIYINADVFVFPSLYDGFGLALMEAMAAGLPAIASYNSGGRDVIEDGKEGFIIPPMNIDKLKEKVIWFCEHKELIPDMGKNARDTVINFTWEDYYKNINLAIEDIMERSNKKINEDVMSETLGN